MYILFEASSTNNKNMFEEYDAMGFTSDEESAMSWVAKNPEYRKYKYCPNINKSRLS